MNSLVLLLQLMSVGVSLLVSRAIFMAISSKLNGRASKGRKFLTTPAGSAILFGLLFVFVWFALGLLAVFVWIAFRRMV